VRVGDAIPPFVVPAVEEDHIRLMALLLRDPNPIHFDLAAVSAAGLGDALINQGAGTMAYALNMLIAWAGSRDAVRRFDCRFVVNVAAGDRVEAGGTVTAVSDDGRTVECEVWVDHADGRRALSGMATVARG
jgi:acyl dehydratase